MRQATDRRIDGVFQRARLIAELLLKCFALLQSLRSLPGDFENVCLNVAVGQSLQLIGRSCKYPAMSMSAMYPWRHGRE